MSEQKSIRVTDADAQSFAQKLRAFGAGLTEAEQAVLVEMCQRAMAGGSDVSGYLAGNSEVDPTWLRTDFVTTFAIFDPSGILQRFNPAGIAQGFLDAGNVVSRERSEALDAR